MEILQYLATFLVACFTSFVGTMVGSGGLVNIPFLILMGLPPQVAVATDRLGVFGMHIGGFSKMFRSGEIIWKYVIPLASLGIVAAIAGANLLLAADEEILNIVIVGIVLLLVPTVFVNKNLGVARKSVSKTRQNFGYFLYFLAMIGGAFFGGGAGTMMLFVLMIFFGLTINNSIATQKIPGMTASIVAVSVYAWGGLIDWTFALFVFLGMLVGGRLGANVALKKGNTWVRILFAATAVLLVGIVAARMFF